MTIAQQILVLLAGGTAAGTRVYPLTAPAGVARPYITYQRISSNSENVLAGDSGLTNTRMQVDVYATTYSQATSIAAEVDALMSAWSVQSVSISLQDFYEDQVQLYRISHDYSLWH